MSASQDDAPLPLIGRKERVSFPAWDLHRVRAKVDTGFELPLIHTRRGEGYILTTEPATRHD